MAWSWPWPCFPTGFGMNRGQQSAESAAPAHLGVSGLPLLAHSRPCCWLAGRFEMAWSTLTCLRPKVPIPALLTSWSMSVFEGCLGPDWQKQLWSLEAKGTHGSCPFQPGLWGAGPSDSAEEKSHQDSPSPEETGDSGQPPAGRHG